jgi:hypothetical protein
MRHEAQSANAQLILNEKGMKGSNCLNHLDQTTILLRAGVTAFQVAGAKPLMEDIHEGFLSSQRALNRGDRQPS